MTDDSRRAELEAELASLGQQPPADNDPIAPGSERFPEVPPTGVRSPASLEIDLNVAPVADVVDGTRIQPQVKVDHVPGLGNTVVTRGPLVEFGQSGDSHPSTVEAAVAQQRIPDDSIHAIHEDADGVRRDPLGHILNEDPRVVKPAPSGPGFE